MSKVRLMSVTELKNQKWGIFKCPSYQLFNSNKIILINHNSSTFIDFEQEKLKEKKRKIKREEWQKIPKEERMEIVEDATYTSQTCYLEDIAYMSEDEQKMFNTF